MIAVPFAVAALVAAGTGRLVLSAAFLVFALAEARWAR